MKHIGKTLLSKCLQNGILFNRPQAYSLRALKPTKIPTSRSLSLGSFTTITKVSPEDVMYIISIRKKTLNRDAYHDSLLATYKNNLNGLVDLIVKERIANIGFLLNVLSCMPSFNRKLAEYLLDLVRAQLPSAAEKPEQSETLISLGENSATVILLVFTLKYMGQVSEFRTNGTPDTSKIRMPLPPDLPPIIEHFVVMSGILLNFRETHDLLLWYANQKNLFSHAYGETLERLFLQNLMNPTLVSQDNFTIKMQFVLKNIWRFSSEFVLDLLEFLRSKIRSGEISTQNASYAIKNLRQRQGYTDLIIQHPSNRAAIWNALSNFVQENTSIVAVDLVTRLKESKPIHFTQYMNTFSLIANDSGLSKDYETILAFVNYFRQIKSSFHGQKVTRMVEILSQMKRVDKFPSELKKSFIETVMEFQVVVLVNLSSFGSMDNLKGLKRFCDILLQRGLGSKVTLTLYRFAWLRIFEKWTMGEIHDQKIQLYFLLREGICIPWADLRAVFERISTRLGIEVEGYLDIKEIERGGKVYYMLDNVD